MQRRGFLGTCATLATAIGSLPSTLSAAANSPLKRYQRVQLTDSSGNPLRSADIAIGESYVFNYPFVTTPAFLLNLGRPVAHTDPLYTEDGARYVWPGGVGPNRSLVAFSAICAHKMTHPAKSVTFINYRHKTVSFRDRNKSLIKRDGVIFCCSEKSVYDPARGAQVLGGPAKQPLCTILIEHDDTDDALYALGSFGGEMFEKFFTTFSVRLQLEWGITDVAAETAQHATVLPIDEYSKSQMICGA